jgi:very-short-patch-repair endonuclease
LTSDIEDRLPFVPQSVGEEQVTDWLIERRIPFTPEWRFHPIRRWRFDFVLGKEPESVRLAVEVEGGAYTGGHKRGAAADTDCEKFNEATLRGWRVLRFTPAMVADGRAWPVILRAWEAVRSA